MPTTKTPAHADEMQYDLAMLPGQEITDDALTTLDNIYDTVETIDELTALLTAAKRMLEQHRSPFEVTERLAVPIQDALDALTANVARLVG